MPSMRRRLPCWRVFWPDTMYRRPVSRTLVRAREDDEDEMEWRENANACCGWVSHPDH